MALARKRKLQDRLTAVCAYAGKQCILFTGLPNACQKTSYATKEAFDNVCTTIHCQDNAMRILGIHQNADHLSFSLESQQELYNICKLYQLFISYHSDDTMTMYQNPIIHKTKQ